MTKTKGLRDSGKEFNIGGTNKFTALSLVDEQQEHQNRTNLSHIVDGSGPQVQNKNSFRSQNLLNKQKADFVVEPTISAFVMVAHQ